MSGWGQPAGDDPFEKVRFGTGGGVKLQSARTGKLGAARQGFTNDGFPSRAASHGPVQPVRLGGHGQAVNLPSTGVAAPQVLNPGGVPTAPGGVVLQDGQAPPANAAAPQGGIPGGVLPPGVAPTGVVRQDGQAPAPSRAAPQGGIPGGVPTAPTGVVLQDGPAPPANGAASPQGANPSGVLPPGVAPTGVVLQDGQAPATNAAVPQGASDGGVLPPGVNPGGVVLQDGELPLGAQPMDLKDLDNIDTSNIPVVDITMVPDQGPTPQPGTQDKRQPYPGPFGMNLQEPPDWRTPQSRKTLSEALRGRGLDESVPAGWYDDPAFGYTHAPGKIEPLSYETVVNGWNDGATPTTSTKKIKPWKPEQGPAGWSKVEVQGRKGQFRKKGDDDEEWL